MRLHALPLHVCMRSRFPGRPKYLFKFIHILVAAPPVNGCTNFADYFLVEKPIYDPFRLDKITAKEQRNFLQKTGQINLFFLRH